MGLATVFCTPLRAMPARWARWAPWAPWAWWDRWARWARPRFLGQEGTGLPISNLAALQHRTAWIPMKHGTRARHARGRNYIDCEVIRTHRGEQNTAPESVELVLAALLHRVATQLYDQVWPRFGAPVCFLLRFPLCPPLRMRCAAAFGDGCCCDLLCGLQGLRTCESSIAKPVRGGSWSLSSLVVCCFR